MKPLLLLLLAIPAFGQSADQPQSRRTVTEHRLELGAVAGSLAADALTTRGMLDRGNYERNTLARPFVSSDAGTVAYFSISYASLLGANHLLRNHPKWQHALNWSLIATETFCSVHNTGLPNRYRRP